MESVSECFVNTMWNMDIIEKKYALCWTESLFGTLILHNINLGLSIADLCSLRHHRRFAST